MNITIKYLYLFLHVVSSVVYAQDENQQPKNVCIANNDIVFGYFNGVLTDEDKARKTLISIEDKFKEITTENSSVVKYQLFYNTTNDLADFREVFEQRAKESSSVLSDKYELFFDSLKGEEDGLWKNLVKTLKSAKELIGSLANAAISNTFKTLTSLIDKPPTLSDYADHQALIDQNIAQGSKFLFFAHSQGNLFANEAHAYAESKFTNQTGNSITADNPFNNSYNVQTIHVAPASLKTSGEHTLANIDWVIKNLKFIGGRPKVNVNLPSSWRKTEDKTGHGLLEIYLKENIKEVHINDKNPKKNKEAQKSPSFIRISRHVNNALQELSFDFNKNKSDQIEAFFALKIDYQGADLKFELTEPNGTKITDFPLKQNGQAGFSETYKYNGGGIFDYYASCYDDKLQTGEYKVKVYDRLGVARKHQVARVVDYYGTTINSIFKDYDKNIDPNLSFRWWQFKIIVDKDHATGIYSFKFNNEFGKN